MAKQVSDYQNLVTSQHLNKPKFMATVAFSVVPSVTMQEIFDSFVPLFDLNSPPVGDQLDIIGEWVGVSRKVPVPIPNVYFTWDGPASQGWEYGTWQPDNQPTDLVTLPDDVFLNLIKARIAANNWDGTTEGAYKIWATLFPSLNILIQDNQNMSFTLAIQGMVPDSLTLALLTQGYLPLKPEGVRIAEYILPVDTNPLFAWDSDTPYLAGWDTGSWGVETPPG